MQIKICGITNYTDALDALLAGADMLGFNFYQKSPRYIQPEVCEMIINQLRDEGFTKQVMAGVFVNHTLDEITHIKAKTGIDLCQLSGDEPVNIMAGLTPNAFKALRPANRFDLAALLEEYPANPIAPAYLVDACVKGEFGGTGNQANWEVAALLAQAHKILLAGGLTSENVSDAIRCVNPWGVDAASGVECRPGKKDKEKMIAFINTVRNME